MIGMDRASKEKKAAIASCKKTQDNIIKQAQEDKKNCGKKDSLTTVSQPDKNLNPMLHKNEEEEEEDITRHAMPPVAPPAPAAPVGPQNPTDPPPRNGGKNKRKKRRSKKAVK